MKKTINIIGCLALAGTILFWGASCRKEASSVAKAVLATESEITFEAKDAKPTLITVYSDAAWTVDAPEWITIEPSTGSGTVDVMITASDNYQDGDMGKPRKDTVVFHGNLKRSRCLVLVNQQGDSYRDAPKVTVSELASVKDGNAVALQESQVMALATNGAVVTDGKANAFAYGLQSRALGDKVTAKGLKSSEDGLPTLGSLERIEGKTGTAVQPTPLDLTEGITAYQAKTIDYVFVKGQLKSAVGGGYNVVTEKGDAAYVLNPVAEIKVEELSGHYVELSGYSFGKKGSASVKVIATSLVDKGEPQPTEPVLPVRWKVGTEDINFNLTWPLGNGNATVYGTSGMVYATTGEGTIWYNNEKANAADIKSGKGNTSLDVSNNCPRVYGTWPGDYCEFRVSGDVPAGRKVRITFETRCSEKGAKYWRLKYLDGTEMKDACETMTVAVEGSDVVYTHEMNADGSTNIQVDATVTYEAATKDIVFRFECQHAIGASGELKAFPTKGTWRLCVTDTASEEWQPTIRYVD